MGRPLRYGPAISTRLPLEDHDRLITKSGDESLSAWLREAALDRLGRRSEPALIASNPEPPVDIARRAAGEDAENRAEEIAQAKCPHTKTSFNGTMKICQTCKKVIR